MEYLERDGEPNIQSSADKKGMEHTPMPSYCLVGSANEIVSFVVCGCQGCRSASEIFLKGARKRHPDETDHVSVDAGQAKVE